MSQPEGANYHLSPRCYEESNRGLKRGGGFPIVRGALGICKSLSGTISTVRGESLTGVTLLHTRAPAFSALVSCALGWR